MNATALFDYLIALGAVLAAAGCYLWAEEAKRRHDMGDDLYFAEKAKRKEVRRR